MFRGLLPRKAICTCNNNVTALHLTAVSEFLYLYEKRNRKDWVQQNKFMFLAAVSGQGNCKSQQRVQKSSHYTTLRRANNMNTLYQNIRIVPCFWNCKARLSILIRPCMFLLGIFSSLNKNQQRKMFGLTCVNLFLLYSLFKKNSTLPSDKSIKYCLMIRPQINY